MKADRPAKALTGAEVEALIRRPIFTVTGTEVTIHSQDFPEHHVEAWTALLEWCEFHDIDPKRVPMLSTITRNVDGCRVEYDQLLVNERGAKILGPDGKIQWRRVHAQGETQPLPWPAELLEAVAR